MTIMPNNRTKADLTTNYKLVCRCCLKADADFYKLDSYTVARNVDDYGSKDSDERIPLLRCLLFCIRTENVAELPTYICAGCCQSLQVAYHFIQNAMRAHEILCHKLCPEKPKRLAHLNGQQKHAQPETKKLNILDAYEAEELKPKQLPIKQQLQEDKEKVKKPVKHECKVCGEIIYNRMELKQHIRLHSDVISLHCTLCTLVTLKQRTLMDHYKAAHGFSQAEAEAEMKMSVKRANSTVSATSSASRLTVPAIAKVSQPILNEPTGKVCTLEDMELLIPTVLRPEDYEIPKSEEDSQPWRTIDQQSIVGVDEPPPPSVETLDLSQFAALDNCSALEVTNPASNNLSIGTEFLVLPDGSLQELNGNGVVFEYINAADDEGDVKKENSVPAASGTNLAMQSLLSDTPIKDEEKNVTAPLSLDLNQLVMEPEMSPIKAKPFRSPTSMKHKCTLCSKSFATEARLKSHQLTHSNLPRFHCDLCAYFSLLGSDLIQHYQFHHGNYARKAPMVPTTQIRLFSCDMCLFETQSVGALKSHYVSKHEVEPTEIQLRPSWCEEENNQASTSKKISLLKEKPQIQTDIPLGITYPRVSNTNVQQQSQQQQPPQQLKKEEEPQLQQPKQEQQPQLSLEPTSGLTLSAPALDDASFVEFPAISTSVVTEQIQSLPTSTQVASMFGDMQEFIDNSDVAAICTIPADEMPVPDADDIVIDGNNISLEFDANLFEDFEEEEEEEEEDEDVGDLRSEGLREIHNDDENDNNDAAIDQNLPLTSDDEDVDDFDDEQSKHLQKPYCIYCNKKFTSQYMFENHMFLHRGLAPYRCELCTNIYNKKRALIRHYKAVHKRMPTRDMVQAKGDKLTLVRSSIERIFLDNNRPTILMCAKCPFECVSEGEMRKHLNVHHGINDSITCHAGEVFIIRKLPFECPRCIRSFAAKQTLTRHLQRSHLVDTIIEVQGSDQTIASSATTTKTTITPTISTLSSDIPSSLLNAGIRKNTFSEADQSAAPAVSEVLEIEQRPSAATPTSPPPPPSTTDDLNYIKDDDKDAPRTVNNSIINNEVNAGCTIVATAAAAANLSPTPTTASTSAAMLFPTPTPLDGFEFDYDFISTAVPTHTTNTAVAAAAANNTTVASTTTVVSSTSDKLLTAAVVDLPRTPIFVCRQCNRTFAELSAFNRHQVEEHQDDRSQFEFKCGICHASYRTRMLLNFHMRRHTKRHLTCEQCPKTFVVRSELEKHRNTHANEKSFKCDFEGCDKDFNYKHHLTRHRNASHLGRKLMCPRQGCDRQLTTKAQLKLHMRSHGQNHLYRCPQCPRSYTRRKPLQQHVLRTHQLHLTNDDLDDVYLQNLGRPNPQDLKVLTRNGELVRRSVVEATTTDESAMAVVNIMK